MMSAGIHWSVSHRDQHQDGQDVEDSVTEQRPPAQGDGLERDTRCTFSVELVQKK